MRQDKKRQTSLKEQSRSAELLKELVDDLDLIFTFGYRPTAVMKYGIQGVREMRDASRRKREREALKRLEDKKLLEIERRAGALYVALTAEGVKEYLRLKVFDTDLYEDDRECLVVFDVPESKRKLRRLLRDFLKSAGFIPIQKSVWISKFNAGEAIRKMLTMNGTKSWVRIYEVREQ